jgi:hypothetical protein
MHQSLSANVCAALGILALVTVAAPTSALTQTKWTPIVLKSSAQTGAGKLKAKGGRKPLLLPAIQAAREPARRPQAHIRHRTFSIIDRTQLHGGMPGGAMRAGPSLRTGTMRIGR